MTIFNDPVPTTPSRASRFINTLSFIMETISEKISNTGLGLLETETSLGSAITPRHPRFQCNIDSTQSFHLNQKITHLGQCHWVNNPPSKVMNNIWASQKKIVKYLLANPDAAVFEEGITSNFPPPYPRNKAGAQELFPAGVPDDLDSISKEQKLFICKAGAVETLYYLGKIQSLPSTILHERLIEIENQVKLANENLFHDSIKHLAFDEREEALIAALKTFLDEPKNKNRKIIIIYGAWHNFEKYFRPNTFEYIATTTTVSFQEKCKLSMAGIKPH